MKKMLKKLNKREGFTLAELLIVVAIIAVLVAISIPVFTSQLEKAKEATDEANLRAAYAEVLAAGMTGSGEGVTVTGTVGSGSAKYSKAVAATQTTAGWTSQPTIGSLTSVAALTKGSSWNVVYDESTGKVTIGE